MEEFARIRRRSRLDRTPASREPHILADRFRFMDDEESRPEEIERTSARAEALFEEIAGQVRYAAALNGQPAAEYWASVVTAFRGLNTAAEHRFATPLGNLTRDRRRMLAGTLMDVARMTLQTNEPGGRAIAIVSLWLETQGLVPTQKIKACSTMAGTLIEGCLETTE